MNDLLDRRLQISVIDYLELAKPSAFCFHVPGSETIPEPLRNKQSRLGVKPGVADLLFILPGGRMGAIALKGPNGTQSICQQAFQGICGKYGVPYKIAHSIEEVAQALREWGCL